MPHPVFTAHRRAQRLRPDASRWLRPDAARFLKPGSEPADIYPALAAKRNAVRWADNRRFATAVAHERAVLHALRCDLARIKSDLA